MIRLDTGPQRGSNRGCDLLLSHGYCLAADEHEREIMMPYPPLGLLYLSSHLKAEGFSVEIHDSTFASPADFEDRLSAARPAVVLEECELQPRTNTPDPCQKVVSGFHDPPRFGRARARTGAIDRISREWLFMMTKAGPLYRRVGERVELCESRRWDGRPRGVDS